MSRSDVEMEDAEKVRDDSENNIQESECKVIEAKDEPEEEVPCAAAASADVNGRGNGGEDLNKFVDEDKDKMDVKTEVEEDQTNPVNEASEPIEGSDCGIIITKSDNKEPINSEIAAEAQTIATSAVEEQGDITNEVVERDATNSGVKEDEPTNNDVVDGNHGEDVVKRPNKDVLENPKAQTVATSAVEKQDDIKNEVIESDATNSGVKEDEPIKNDVVDGNHGEDVEKRPNKDVVEKPEAQPVATNAVEKQGDIKNEVIESDATNSGVKQDDPTKNDVVDGNHAEDVEKRPIKDVVEKPPEEIGKDADGTEHAAGEMMVENADAGNVPSPNRPPPTEFSANKDPHGQDTELGDVQPGGDEQMDDAVRFDQDEIVKDKEQGAKSFLVSHETDGNGKTFETAAKPDAEESSLANQHEPFTPNSLVRCSSAKTEDHSGETAKTVFTQATQPFMGEDDDGTPEDQAAFMKELEHFYRERSMDFKPPKFYGQPLNCLKLWRAVIRLGGYDRVTGSKLWRQVGESFHPPKTCTTVSWTFRIFYEKSLLEFERHKTQNGELQLPVVMLPEVSGADGEGNGYQGSGSGPGRARRDAAARAMQGWHAQRLLGAGEVGDPIIKDKNLNNMAKNEKNLKNIGSLKQKRPNEVEHSSKAARTEVSKQLVTSVVDVGPPADWVKINVRQTKDCFEVYALVPGLLREEVRVQSDPAGRLVITGQPEQVDNPWGITPFKKVISLPARIHPVQTSAVVSLHGRLFVRVPFEQPNI